MKAYPVGRLFLFLSYNTGRGGAVMYKKKLEDDIHWNTDWKFLAENGNPVLSVFWQPGRCCVTVKYVMK
mgnify:CR=1 FL=1